MNGLTDEPVNFKCSPHSTKKNQFKKKKKSEEQVKFVLNTTFGLSRDYQTLTSITVISLITM